VWGVVLAALQRQAHLIGPRPQPTEQVLQVGSESSGSDLPALQRLDRVDLLLLGELARPVDQLVGFSPELTRQRALAATAGHVERDLFEGCFGGDITFATEQLAVPLLHFLW
jgi:hypothetical protein